MPEATRVIDMWAPIVPSHEIIAHTSENFPDAMLGYIRVFFKRDPTPEVVRKFMSALDDHDLGTLKLLNSGTTRPNEVDIETTLRDEQIEVLTGSKIVEIETEEQRNHERDLAEVGAQAPVKAAWVTAWWPWG